MIYSKAQEQGDGLLEEVVVVALIWLGAQLCRVHGHLMYIPTCIQCRSLGTKQMRRDGGDIKELVMEVCGSTSPTRGGIGSESTSNTLRGLFERLSKCCGGGGFCVVVL